MVNRQSMADFAALALAFERRNLSPQLRLIADTAVQTPSAEDAQLDLSHVQPAAMRRSVMKLEALGDAPSFARLKCFVERAELVGVEVSSTSLTTSASG